MHVFKKKKNGPSQVDYHCVREKVVNSDILIKFISTNDHIADIFIKGLTTTQFNFLKSQAND
jgi:hypothetical protein